MYQATQYSMQTHTELKILDRGLATKDTSVENYSVEKNDSVAKGLLAPSAGREQNICSLTGRDASHLGDKGGEREGHWRKCGRSSPLLGGDPALASRPHSTSAAAGSATLDAPAKADPPGGSFRTGTRTQAPSEDKPTAPVRRRDG